MIGWILDYWKALAIIINALFMLIVWALTQTFAKNRHVSELSHRVDTLEKAMENAPESKDIHRLELEVKELNGSIRGMNKTMAHIRAQTDMLVENEIKGSN